MRRLILAGLLTATVSVPADAQEGRVQAGKALWDSQMCSFCHGNYGEGGFGPELAHRASSLTLAQFTRAVRAPWGVMPQFGESQLSDQNLADMHAYLGSLPEPRRVGHWHWDLPPNDDAPVGQVLQVSFGCGQCHEPELGMPRRQLGAIARDTSFEYFADAVWNHNEKYPKGRMGSFSRERLPEVALREIYDFMMGLGLRVPMSGTIRPATGEHSYTVQIANTGTPGKGLDAEIVTVSIVVPDGFSVASTEGEGYQGVRPAKAQMFYFDGSGRVREWEADAMIWKVPRIAAGGKQNFSFTLKGSGTPAADGFEGSMLWWEKPLTRMEYPDLEYRDVRIPEVGDANFILFRP